MNEKKQEQEAYWVFCRTNQGISRFGPFDDPVECKQVVVDLVRRPTVISAEWQFCDGTISVLPFFSVWKEEA